MFQPIAHPEQTQHSAAFCLVGRSFAAHVNVERTRAVAVRKPMTNVDGCCTLDYLVDFLGHAGLRERMTSDGYLIAVENNDGSPEVLVTPDGQSWFYNRYGMTDEARYAHEATKVGRASRRPPEVNAGLAKTQ